MLQTHSDEDTYNISTSGTLGAGNATLGTVNDLTLASAATGFTIAGGSTSKTLTVNDIFNVSTQLAAIGANTAKVTCNFTNVQTALAAASGAVDFNQQHLTGVYNIIGVSSGVPEFKHSIDDGAIYISGGSAYDHGGSLQFYGEDQASYPGDVYIVSGSHDATPASVIQLAYRSAGSYQTIMTLGNDRHIDIWDWDDSAMREVSFGADDSGGAGYKVLRIPN